MRIAHVVVTSAFAGTERYAAEVARRQADRGHDVVVLGGAGDRMPDLCGRADWAPAGSLRQALTSLWGLGRADVVHSHLTAADIAAAMVRHRLRARHVSTRHIAAPRGASRAGRIAVPLVQRSVSLEIAISEHVARRTGTVVDLVLPNGVATSDTPYDVESRTVLVLQRLSPEKDTRTALRAWHLSGLAGKGWRLDIAGDGAERPELERLVADDGMGGVRFLGRVDDPAERLSAAAVLIASATSEPLGLSVLEAMARGVPVIASAAGGHLETLPAGWPYFFPAGDAAAAGEVLRRLTEDSPLRQQAEVSLRDRQRTHFDVETHVDVLLTAYASPAARRGPRA